MDNIDNENERYLAAKQRVKQIKSFYVHATVYVLVNMFIIAQSVRGGANLTDMDNYWTAVFWGIGLLAHAISVFVPHLFLGKDWEARKTKELMEKYK